MQIKGMTSREYFLILTIIHAALIIGQVLFGFVSFYINLDESSGKIPVDFNNMFLILFTIFILSGFIATTLIIKSKLKRIKIKIDLKEKLRDYRSLLILNYALLEGLSLISIICYFLTINYFFLGFSGLIIAVFVINKPSINKTVNDLELNQDERKLIEFPNTIVTEVELRNE